MKESWQPVLSVRLHADATGRVVTGDVEETFLELHLAKAAPVDEHSPVFVRSDPNRPELFEITYLSSDPLGVHRHTAVAFDPQPRPEPFTAPPLFAFSASVIAFSIAPLATHTL